MAPLQYKPTVNSLKDQLKLYNELNPGQTSQIIVVRQAGIPEQQTNVQLNKQ